VKKPDPAMLKAAMMLAGVSEADADAYIGGAWRRKRGRPAVMPGSPAWQARAFRDDVRRYQRQFGLPRRLAVELVKGLWQCLRATQRGGFDYEKHRAEIERELDRSSRKKRSNK
jgi:hypothetical protein